MLYNVKFACGHEQNVQLYGTHEERERKIWYFENRCECDACKAAARAAAAAEASAKAAENGLPTLEGSPKQVAWAEQIRQEIIAKAEKRIDEVRTASASSSDPRYAEALSLADKILQDLKNNTSAKWYIDHRATNINHILAGIA